MVLFFLLTELPAANEDLGLIYVKKRLVIEWNQICTCSRNEKSKTQPMTATDGIASAHRCRKIELDDINQPVKNCTVFKG